MRDFFAHLVDEFQLPLASPVLVFSVILLIILLSPIVLRRLNIPGIIGLIISGVIIGPNGLHVLAANEAIELFSTIGLLYVMFIAGLELDLQEFKIYRYKSLAFGILTFAMPMAIGYPICHHLLGYSPQASLLAASMLSTHTLVSYPIVNRFGIAKDPAVAIAVGGTILTDTAVLILLSVILGSANDTAGIEHWFTFGASLLMFALIMFVVIPRTAGWFFRTLESEKHSHYIFVLAVVFFAAFLAEVAGVEKIIGAFVAGLALNKLIPHSSALMNRIEFMGNSLFIPFFLISVGMIVDPRALFAGNATLIAASALILAGLLGKWIPAWVTQKAFGFSASRRTLLFGLSSARVAAALAVVLVGFRAGILDEPMLNGTILLILISCIVASFATERAARALALESNADSQQTSTPAKSEHLLIPIGATENTASLVEFASLIKEQKSPNPISLLTVVSNDAEAEANLMKARKALEPVVAQASATETRVNPIATIDHNPSSGIARISKELMADAIILGWPVKRGFIDKLFGEQLELLLNSTEKTIAVVRISKPLVSMRRIFLVAPEFAHRETGFAIWSTKLARLAKELSIPIHLHSVPSVHQGLEAQFRRTSTTAVLEFAAFDAWEDFLVLSREIRPDDLLVVVSARKNSISWNQNLEGLPVRLDKYFPQNNRILIFPEQIAGEVIAEAYEDFSAEPLNKGLATVQRLSRGLGALLGGDRRRKAP